MSRLSYFAGTVAAVSIVLASARTLFAGVVMTETSTASGPAGIASQNRTVYVQGNKQKVEGQGIDAITDLDKSVIYIVDKENKSYAELSLRAVKAAQPEDSQDETIQLKTTGEKRLIANHSCSEYRGVAGNAVERVTVGACASSSAPGANEMTAFERKMVSRLSGHKPGPSAENHSAAVMLERQSVVSLRLPELSRRKAYRTATLRTKTRVNDIQLTQLAGNTFKPPKDFSKLRNRPGANLPPLPPNLPEEVIQTMAPNLPDDSESAFA
jgi:nitrogen fixation protein FixH